MTDISNKAKPSFPLALDLISESFSIVFWATTPHCLDKLAQELKHSLDLTVYVYELFS